MQLHCEFRTTLQMYIRGVYNVHVHAIARNSVLRNRTKEIFNPQFGSIFRTFENPTYFSRRLNRFADIYTSSVVNLLNYSVNHTFYTRRSSLPHELPVLHAHV